MGTIRLKVGAVRTVVLGADPEVLSEVRQLLTVQYPGHQHTYAYKSGRWDGQTRFLAPAAKSFPTGLLDRIVKHLGEKGHEVTLDAPKVPGVAYAPDTIAGILRDVTLRPYQVKAVVHALKSARMAIQCPTGAGKTEIGAALVKIIRAPTLWLVHRKELLFQTAERLEARLGFKGCGIIGAGIFNPRFLTVGMVPSLHNHLTTGEVPWDNYGVLIVDEVHHLSAQTWFQITEKCVNAFWRFGLSGTIITGNPVKDLKLEGATGPIYVAAETMALAEEGFLAKPRIVLLRPDPNSYPTYPEVRDHVYPEWRKNPRALAKLGGKLFRASYERGIIHNDLRNLMIATVANHHVNNGEKVMVLCTSLAHGKALEKQLAQFEPWWLSGKETDETRKIALRAFKVRPGPAVIIASTIFDEGVDIPEIDALILAGGGESYIKAIQKVGRALRPRKDKPEVLIYDFVDGRNNHPKDYLANHSKARREYYEQQGFSIDVRGRT